jgi:hypothetical protein
MLSKIFGKIAKTQEFETPEVKLNKKVSKRSASDEVPTLPASTVQPFGTQGPQGPQTTKKQKSKAKKRVDELNSLERHYYDQIRSLLSSKSTNKEAIRKSIEKMPEKAEISNNELLSILDMF